MSVSSFSWDPGMQSSKSGPKKKPDINSLKEKYLQAVLDGNKTLTKFYGDMIIKLGHKIPRAK